MKSDFKNEWICEQCGVVKDSYAAGYTQEMENEITDFISLYFPADSEKMSPKNICSHPSWKRDFEPSIVLNSVEGINNRLLNN